MRLTGQDFFKRCWLQVLKKQTNKKKRHSQLSKLWFMNMEVVILWGGCLLIKLRAAVIENVTPASPCIIILLSVPMSFPLVRDKLNLWAWRHMRDCLAPLCFGLHWWLKVNYISNAQRSAVYWQTDEMVFTGWNSEMPLGFCIWTQMMAAHHFKLLINFLQAYCQATIDVTNNRCHIAGLYRKKH